MTRVAIALDLPSRAEALAMVERLGDEADLYKVGLELFTRAGPPVLDALRKRGKGVFLDLKLHDIPNTVAGAVRAARRREVHFLTVHTTGGRQMMEAAAEAAAGDPVEGGGGEGTSPARLLGVTLLTSLSASEVETTWDRELLSIRDEVVRLATLAEEAGLDGAVASVQEAEILKRRLGDDFLVATPGIRLAGGDTHDQTRVATPTEAVEAGADILVVGRAVTAAPEPRAALSRVVDEARRAEEAGR